MRSLRSQRRKPGRLVGGYGQGDKRRVTHASLNPINGTAIILNCIKGTLSPAGVVNAVTGILCEVLTTHK